MTATADQQLKEETFDAVIVASGHFSKPYIPEISGSDLFPNRIIHTQNYRRPDEFRNKVRHIQIVIRSGLGTNGNPVQNVIVVGGASSGIDIMREVARVAGKVYLSLKDPDSVGDIGESLDTLASRSEALSSPAREPSPLSKVVKKGIIKNFARDGSVEFEDGTIADHVDAVIFATGYLYDFPYLHPSELSGGDWLFGTEVDERGVPSVDSVAVKEGQSNVLVTDGHGVHNLYRHMLYIPNPTLAFVGLPLKVCPFPLFEVSILRYCVPAFLLPLFVEPSL